MLGVFKNGKRIGSLLKFPHEKLPWVAYGPNKTSKQFKLKREAVAWLGALSE